MKNPIRITSGMTIVPSQEAMIDELMASQLEKTQARLILLIDSSGQVISFYGERGSIDLIGLGALVAGDMAASQEIARMTDLYQDNQMVIRQGSKMNTVVYDLNRNLILLFIVPSSVPLGWVCYMVRDSAAKIKDVLSKVENVEPGFSFTSQDEELGDLIDQALNNVWKD